MRIVLLGPPGAGKGTQAALLAERGGFAHVATGDLFRAHLGRGTELGKLAKSYMDSGALVPDDVTTRMVLERFGEPDAAAGFVPAEGLAEGLYARIETSLGRIVARLLPEQAPQSVAHFAAMAEGQLEWFDMTTGVLGT